MDETYTNLVTKFIEAYNLYDIDTMLLLVRPEISFKSVSRGSIDAQTVGREDFRKVAFHSTQLFTEIRREVISLLVIGNRVIAEIKYHAVVAHHSSEGLGKGSSIDIDGKSEYAFRDGLISSIVDETW